MAKWSWVIILLLSTSCFFIYIKADLAVSIREDEWFQGLRIEIHSRFYTTNREYNYTDPNLRLGESILIAAFYKWKNRHQKSPAVSPDHEEPSILKGFPIRNIGRRSLENDKILALVLHFLILEKLEWKSTVGSRDALATALAAGAGWAFKGMTISLLSNRCRINKVEIDVRPDYANPAFVSRLICILKMRIVHIIIIEIYILAIKVRWCIDGIRAGTVQPSH